MGRDSAREAEVNVRGLWDEFGSTSERTWPLGRVWPYIGRSPASCSLTVLLEGEELGPNRLHPSPVRRLKILAPEGLAARVVLDEPMLDRDLGPGLERAVE